MISKKLKVSQIRERPIEVRVSFGRSYEGCLLDNGGANGGVAYFEEELTEVYLREGSEQCRRGL